MLTSKQATEIVKSAFPNGKIQSFVEHDNLYVFQVFSDEPGEEEFDPFFSVNKETGVLLDFSILTDENAAQIADLFEKKMR